MRYTFRTSLIGFCLFAGMNSSHAANDINSIRSSASLIFEGHTESSVEKKIEYVDSLTELVLINVRKISEREGITSAAQLDSDAFAENMRSWISNQVDAASQTASKSDRKSKLYKLLRGVSTQRFAEKAITQWLHLPDLAPVPNVVGPRANSQVRLQSSDGRLKLHLSDTARLEDVGGPGSGNGVADAGEWVKIKLGIYNASPTPFVSSSAWVTVGGNCGWTFADEEIQLPEMSPADPDKPTGEPPSQMGEIESWIYLSETCSHNTDVPLTFRIQDTHEATSRAILLTAKIRVTNRGRGQVMNYMVDSDIPGFSEGAKSTTIVPDLRLEFSHGLSTGPGQVEKANMTWSMADLTAAMLQKNSYRASEPMVLEGSTLAFGDDLDIETHAEETPLHTAIDNMGKAWNWDSVDDARLWLLSDTLVEYTSMDPPSGEVVEIPDEVCNNYLDDDSDGKHDCQDSDCAEADVCQDPPQALSIQQILKLVKENTQIVASPANPNLDGAISAVDPNYELLFNNDEFKLRYGCMVNGLPLNKCGAENTHQRCTDELDNDSDGKLDCEDSDCGEICKLINELAEKEAASEQEEEKAEKEDPRMGRRGSTVAYAYRHFFTLPIQVPPEGSPETCFDEWDNDLDGDPDCQDSACRELCEQKENDHDQFGPYSCRNGKDDDLDRKIDCDDPNCFQDPYCHDESEYGFHGVNSCQDGIDNDLRDDGIDCNDKDGCRQSPECARPTLWSIDLGAAINSLAVTDVALEEIVWDSWSLTSLFLRPSFSWGGRGKDFAPWSIFGAMELQPGQALLRDGGAVYSQVLGGGLAMRVPLGSWLILEPNLLIGKKTMRIGSPNIDDLEAVKQPFYHPGVTIRTGPFQTGGFALSGFFDASLMTPIDFVVEDAETVDGPEDQTILDTGRFNMRVGVGFHF